MAFGGAAVSGGSLLGGQKSGRFVKQSGDPVHAHVVALSLREVSLVHIDGHCLLDDRNRSVVLEKQEVIVSYQEFGFSLICLYVVGCHIRNGIDVVQKNIAAPDSSEQGVPVGNDGIAGVVIAFREVGEGLVLPRRDHLVGCHKVQRRCLVTRLRKK